MFVFAISRIRKNTSYRINILIFDALYMFVLEDFVLMISAAPFNSTFSIELRKRSLLRGVCAPPSDRLRDGQSRFCLKGKC